MFHNFYLVDSRLESVVERVDTLVDQMARLKLRRVERVITSWITGVEATIDLTDLDFVAFQTAVGECFGFHNPLVYALPSPGHLLAERVKLNEMLYRDFYSRTGLFTKITKLYVCDKDSPTTSPGGKTIPDDAASSQSKISSNRSGQTEFRDSILRRDKNKCVFCGTTTPPIEAAHVLPVEQKNILLDEDKCILYGIHSIMDSSNGIALCWALMQVWCALTL